MNNTIKLWQGRSKVDMAKFVQDIEDLIKDQESEVIYAFTGVQSKYEVRPEFNHLMIDFNTQYAPLSKENKIKKRLELLNIIVDETSYKETIGYSGVLSIERMRMNLESALTDFPEEWIDASQSAKRDLVDLTDDNDEVEILMTSLNEDELLENDSDLEAQRLSEALGESDVNLLRDMVLKAKRLCDANGISEQVENLFWVKSSSSEEPHVVKIISDGYISCDQKCKMYKQLSLCAHSLAVSYKRDNMPGLLSSLRKKKKPTLTKIATLNVNTSVAGKKRPQRQRTKGNGTLKFKRQKIENEEGDVFQNALEKHTLYDVQQKWIVKQMDLKRRGPKPKCQNPSCNVTFTSGSFFAMVEGLKSLSVEDNIIV